MSEIGKKYDTSISINDTVFMNGVPVAMLHANVRPGKSLSVNLDLMESGAEGSPEIREAFDVFRADAEALAALHGVMARAENG